MELGESFIHEHACSSGLYTPRLSRAASVWHVQPHSAPAWPGCRFPWPHSVAPAGTTVSRPAAGPYLGGGGQGGKPPPLMYLTCYKIQRQIYKNTGHSNLHWLSRVTYRIIITPSTNLFSTYMYALDSS